MAIYAAFHSPAPPTFSRISIIRSPTTSPRQSPIPLIMRTPLPHAGVTAPKGFKAASHTAGFKPSGLPDLALVASTTNTPLVAAAVFTKNILRAAPITLSESHMSLSHSRIVAVLLNSGQANAATGDAGMQDAIESARILALQLGCKPENILLCSTGVIGRRFDIQKMTAAIPTLVSKATESLDAGTSAAQAILTTDLVLKQVSYQANISGSLVTVGAMCKGSGMIHPNMATMLSVVTCDADVDPVLWRDILQRAVDKSFNVITVDGDTSTNDIVCALCSGASGASIHDSASPEAKQLEQLVADACIHMAKSIARDGEGATALLEIRASGAASDSDARAIAKTVAGSNLFKAAVFGRDPNWGRIAAATGRANIDFDINNLTIRIGDHLLMERGTPLQFDASAASQYMLSKSQASKEQYMTEHDTIVVTLQVGDGPGSGTAWGCDLSYKYVEINAEYTT